MVQVRYHYGAKKPFPPTHPAIISQSTDDDDDDDCLVLYESPSVLAADGTTGHKTWEAALALGDALLSSATTSAQTQTPARTPLVAGKRVLELGAGTGFLSLLCARLGAAHVFATDGSEAMVNLMRTNVANNAGVEKVMTCRTLWFGPNDNDDDDGLEVYDGVRVILGADVTYDESILAPLCHTMAALLRRNPAAQVFIAATVRRQQT